MTETVDPTVSDVILSFKRAEEKAGHIAAMAVVRQFGADYAATIPAAHYTAAIHQFTAIASGGSATAPIRLDINPDQPNERGPNVNPPSPSVIKRDQTVSDSDRIKAAWKKGRET